MIKKLLDKIKVHWPILIILALSAFLRLYRLPQLTTFGGDQGIDLLAVKRMIVEKRFTLLGPKTSIMSIYNGPIYYYLALPFLYLTDLNPLSASYLMVFFWLGAIFLSYILAKEIFNQRAALFGTLFFAFWPLGIEYSRQSFNSFPTPFFAALFMLGIWRFFSRSDLAGIVLAGLCGGILIQLHYFNFFLLAGAWVLLILKRKLAASSLILFIVAFGLTFSPMIAFELRHKLFNSRTLVNSLTGGGLGDFRWQIHYAIAFFPATFILAGALIELIYKRKPFVALATAAVVLISFVLKLDLDRNHGFTMPEGWNYLGVKKAGEIIARDAQGSFNVASIIDGDTRAYPFRYIIEAKGKKPLGVEEYPQAEFLYVVARKSEEEILTYPVWEISSFLPASVVDVWPVQNGYRVIKLKRIKEEG